MKTLVPDSDYYDYIDELHTIEHNKEVRKRLLRGVLHALGITAVVLSIVLGVFYGVRG